MRTITVDPPMKVADDKIVIRVAFPAWSTNLTVEEARDLGFQLTKALISLEYKKVAND